VIAGVAGLNHVAFAHIAAWFGAGTRACGGGVLSPWSPPDGLPAARVGGLPLLHGASRPSNAFRMGVPIDARRWLLPSMSQARSDGLWRDAYCSDEAVTHDEGAGGDHGVRGRLRRGAGRRPGKGLGEGGERLHDWVFGGPWTYAEEPRGEPAGAGAEWLATTMARIGAVVGGRWT
jgi:hypothetical protein